MSEFGLRVISKTFVSRVSFGDHGFHDTPFGEAGDDTSYNRLYDNFVLLVLEDRFGFGPITVVNLRDGHGTFYDVPKIDRALETKSHSRGQPADLSANFRDHAGHQESMTNAGTKVFCAGEAIIKMDGIIVSTGVGKGEGVLFGEGA